MDEPHPCGGPGCRKKKVTQEEAWAIADGFHFCCKECYLRYIKKNHPKVYEQQLAVLGVV